MALPAPTLAKNQKVIGPTATFVTTSWTPNVAARLYFAWLNPFLSGGANAPSAVTGNGLTWSKVLDTDLADVNSKLGSLWAAYGTGTAGALTISMGGVSHGSCMVLIVEQSGVTGSSAILQSVKGKSTNTNTLSITMGATASSASSMLGFFGVKAVTTVGAEDIVPGSGYTQLVEDEIDDTRMEMIEYRLSASTTVDVTLTGDDDGNYTAHSIWGVGVELAAAVPWVGKVEVIVDIDPDDLPSDPDDPDDPDVEVPPVIVDIPVVLDTQAAGARPVPTRTRDLPTALSQLERRLQRMEGARATQLGYIPVLTEDPSSDWPDGKMWTRYRTGELCLRIGSVTQVWQPSTPIGTREGTD